MGQVAIYDAVNPTAEGRKQLSKEFLKHEIQVHGSRSTWPIVAVCWDPRCLQTIFIESYVDDPKIIEQNVRSVKISSPDVSYQLVYMTGGLLLINEN